MTYRPYYTLLSCDDFKSPWLIEYGSYDHADVVAERDDFVEHGHKRCHLRIITTDHKQEAIAARVNQLNERVAARVNS